MQKEHRTHFEASGLDGMPTLSVTISGDHSDPESFTVVGSKGEYWKLRGARDSGRQGAQRQITFSRPPYRVEMKVKDS